MDCVSNHSMFLRSNGSLACWCDYGSLKTLQPFDPKVDYASDVYLGKVFGYIRESLEQDRHPYPAYCSKCMVLAPESPYSDYYVSNRRVATFQVEPSMACQLDCPGCIPIAERKGRVKKTEHGHMILDPSILEKILGDLHRAGLQVDRFDFQGHGEPTLNRDVWKMIATAKRLFPRSDASMCTNAIADFSEEMVEAGLDEILYAIDGCDQASYEPYRVHGKFGVAYDFMKAFSAEVLSRGKGTRTVWKYVLFDHNDREEQLLQAQELAHEAKVSELRFIITQLGDSSTKILDESEIPRASTPVNVKVVNYKVRLEQLQSGVEEMKKLLGARRPQDAGNSALFVMNMISRNLISARNIPAPYRPIFRALVANAPKLPTKAAETIRNEVARLEETLPYAPPPRAPGKLSQWLGRWRKRGNSSPGSIRADRSA